MPFYESVTTAPEAFAISVDDPNPFDTLWVRWISDYPPYSSVRSRLLFEGAATRGAIAPYAVSADCREFLKGTPSPHRLVVVVADRAFRPPEQAENPDLPYNSVTENGFSIMAGWLVTCP